MILRAYQEGDMGPILSLFSQCFGREMKANFWEWRFLNNPVCQCLIYLAWDNETLASHYAVSPVVVSIEDEDYLTNLSMTTMTHPKYRGLKLFPKLAEEIYNQMKEFNHLMVWGFPNNKSHRTFIRDLAWKDIYEIPTMQLDLVQNNKKYFVNIVTDNQFDLDYVDRFHSPQLMHVKKDKQYLRWRYAEHPVNQYTNIVIAEDRKVSSFCVVKKYLNSLDIVDFQSLDEQEGKNLLTQIISFANLNNLDFINCWAPRHHFFHSLCEKAGFINKEPITYLGFRQLSNTNMGRVSDNYSDWYIQMGDSDVY